MDPNDGNDSIEASLTTPHFPYPPSPGSQSVGEDTALRLKQSQLHAWLPELLSCIIGVVCMMSISKTQS
jgi:hypothetical protein